MGVCGSKTDQSNEEHFSVQPDYLGHAPHAVIGVNITALMCRGSRDHTMCCAGPKMQCI